MDDWAGIARSHFSPQENAALHSTAESDRQIAFFRCWTRKEAFLKADGQGLSKPLDSFAVSLAPEEFPELLSCEWDSRETLRWSLVSLTLDPGFIGALAIERRDWKIRCFDWVNSAGRKLVETPAGVVDKNPEQYLLQIIRVITCYCYILRNQRELL